MSQKRKSDASGAGVSKKSRTITLKTNVDIIKRCERGYTTLKAIPSAPKTDTCTSDPVDPPTPPSSPSPQLTPTPPASNISSSKQGSTRN
ncbi:hypothetical protein Hamer_G014402 [Homarus americanus]|uniref:Uncharacterized protein n=1 Tax=Homarus americanus TaxID=6706 RepID=A0A8J5JTB5_HOMAM|nr:hypothetical protein Hamer_G014402 [Homarus americanus]